MAGLTEKSIAESYDQLIISSNSSGGDTSNLINLQDGDGVTTFCASMTDASTGKAILSIDGSHADGTALQIDNSAGDGDVLLEFQLSGTTTFVMGIEDGESDKFTLCAGTALGSNQIMNISGATGEVVFNENQVDLDFRVEGADIDDALFVDAANNRVGIGTKVPCSVANQQSTAAALLDVKQSASDAEGIRFTSNGSESLFNYIGNNFTTSNDDSQMNFYVASGGSDYALHHMTLRGGRVGIGAITDPEALLSVVGAEAADSIIEMWADEGDDGTDRYKFEVDESTNHLYIAQYHNGLAYDSQLRLYSGTGVLATDGGVTTGATEVDYAEYFETSDGKAIAIGVTVVLVDGKIRSAEEGESPFGVLRPADSSALIGGAADLKWQGKYLADDFGSTVWEDYEYTGFRRGKKKVGKRRKLNPDYDNSLEYVPRSDRDEWQVVGLLGQVGILKGQPVASSWIKMGEISDSVDLYYIFPCPQVIDNKGESSDE